MNKTLNKKAQELINKRSEDSSKHPLVLMVNKNTLETMNIYTVQEYNITLREVLEDLF